MYSSDSNLKTNSHTAIVFFDSECLLCNKAIQLIARHDFKDYFRFGGLQSNVAEELLHTVSIPEELDSIILYEEGKCFYEWEAVWKIARRLRYWHLLSYVMRIVPKSLGNVLYRWVARNRKIWFGKNERCDLGLRHKMID